MLRKYFSQQWFSLQDDRFEDAIYDSLAFSCFLNIDWGRKCAPDATTLLCFRRLLEHELTGTLFETLNHFLRQRGLLVEQRTMGVATILYAPSSIKNKYKQRDLEMHQTKEGNQYRFGMKAHIGVDVESELVYNRTTTAADTTETHRLLHGKETWISADAGYTGRQKHKE